MIELIFIDTVAASLSSAFAVLQSGADAADAVTTQSPEALGRICRLAARQLFTELDGKALLDMALDKMRAEEQAGIGVSGLARSLSTHVPNV